MATITLQGNTIHTIGELPSVGNTAPDFVLVNKDLAEISLSNFAGKHKLLSVVPSLDTGICAKSTIVFNEAQSKLTNTAILIISSDLPFAANRFCQAESTAAVTTLSLMRNRNFAKDYGLLITDGPLSGICARAVLVLDENNTVVHAELVPEIAQEPNYTAALAHCK